MPLLIVAVLIYDEERTAHQSRKRGGSTGDGRVPVRDVHGGPARGSRGAGGRVQVPDDGTQRGAQVIVAPSSPLRGLRQSSMNSREYARGKEVNPGNMIGPQTGSWTLRSSAEGEAVRAGG